MSDLHTSRVSATARPHKPLHQVLQEFVLGKLENDVFRMAFLTVLLIAAVQEFSGWKYAGVVMRELNAAVQSRLLPWSNDSGPPNAFNEQRRQVVSLVIDDALFASPEGFDHQVPLRSAALQRLLEQVLAAAPNARIVVDFDLAPRAEDASVLRDKSDPAEPGATELVDREALTQWLAAHASRLFLVEPAWATADKDAADKASTAEKTLARQLDWARRLCGLDSLGRPTTHTGLVLVQPTIQSRFGFVQDTAEPSGKQGPAWDIGRAVADHALRQGHKRNPLCERLRTPGTSGQDDAMVAALALLKSNALREEFRAEGQLRIEPQPMSEQITRGEVVLRHDFIDVPSLKPATFAEMRAQPQIAQALAAAKVVVIGGVWRYGFADHHTTFVGVRDGVDVHAAWVRSWLTPLAHLNKLLDILLDAVIIEALLHPILEYAFVAMRQRAELHRLGHAPNLKRPGPGRHVGAAVLLAGLAALATAGTAVALMLIDGVLRWCLNLSLSIDTTLLALALWGLVVLYRMSSGAAAHSQQHLAAEARLSGVWLMVTLAAALAATHAVHAASGTQPAVARGIAWALIVGLPLAYVAFSAWRNTSAAASPLQAAAHGQRSTRARWRRLRRRAFRGWSSNLRAMGYALRSLAPMRRKPRRDENWDIAARWADGIGALIWSAVWVYTLYVLFKSTLWGMLVANIGV